MRVVMGEPVQQSGNHHFQGVVMIYRYTKPVRKERREYHSTTSLATKMPAKLLALVKTEKMRADQRFKELHELLKVQILKIGRRNDLWEKMKTDVIWQRELYDLCKNAEAWSEVMVSVKFMYDEFTSEESWKLPWTPYSALNVPRADIGQKNFNRALEMLGLER